MDSTIRLFRSEEIPVYEPGHVEYERSAAVANLLYRFARPDCVVQPANSSDVQIIVKQAKEQNIKITIKNGGHSYAGFSTTNGGILLDLVKMKKVSLDIKSETVTLQGGALWGHAYKKLVDGRHDRYVINGGRCPTVGVSGFILGGGLGPFTRSLGMGCDSLKEVTIVTADGKEVTVKDSGNPGSNEDRLFWALRGAGGGNFGVVVGLKMSVQKLQDPDVVAGRYTWSPKPEEMEDFMTAMKDFYKKNWEPRMTIDSSWLCDLKQTTSELAVRFIVYYDGTKESFNRIITESVQHAGLAEQLKKRSLAEKSTRFLHETLVSQWSEEIVKSFPSNRSYTIYSSFVFENNRRTCENVPTIIRNRMKAFRDKFPGEQALLQVTWIHSGGKASEKGPEDTAFPWRASVYHTYIMMQWDEKWLEGGMRDFLQNFTTDLRRFSMRRLAAFVNFPDAALPPNIHERAYFGSNYLELRRIKKIWDEDNFFSWSQGVQLPEPEGRALVSDSIAPLIVKMEEGYDEDATEEPVANERDLTDTIAREQWETWIPERKNEFEGGVVGLTDLGF